jgi:hypothetical protein
MQRTRDRLAAVLLLVLVSTGCGGSISDEYVIEHQPYTLEPVEGTDLQKVTLTQSASDHLGVETRPVEVRGSHLMIPYDAVFIDAHGGFWVYTNPAPLEFVRAPIEIARESSTHAFLSEGPPAGTPVVTVGVPELYGSEIGFGT